MTAAALPDGGGVLWFDDPACRDVATAGGKGASLAAMVAADLPVPCGFVVPAAALPASLESAGTLDDVRDLLGRLDGGEEVAALLEPLRDAIVAPEGRLAEEIRAAYGQFDDGTRMAVRSSACAEDSEAASFAGQQETYLNVATSDEVLARIGDCWASFFTERALFYRRQKGRVTDLAIAVVVQELVDAEASGVLFTIDPVRRRRDQMLAEAAWGLGEGVVAGLVTPDTAVLRRTGAIKTYTVGHKDTRIVSRPDGGTASEAVPDELRDARVLDEDHALQLAELGARLEELHGCPQDIEWAISDDRLVLLQSRPITT